jgi:hypothetical protein
MTEAPWQAQVVPRRRRRWLLVLPGVLLIVLGIVWISVFYLSQGEYPIVGLQYVNLAVGGGLVCMGAVLTVVIALVLAITASARKTRRPPQSG